MKIKYLVSALLVVGFAAPALATDGYFSHGYGMTAKGMAGISTPMAKDTFGGANNPASMVWVGDRLDAGMDVFLPHRSAERSGSLAGIDAAVPSRSNLFLIPEFGYNKMLGQEMAVGVTVYANGGMNTNYPGGQIAGGPGTVCNSFNPGTATTRYNLLCGNGELGQNTLQLIVAPTFSFKVGPDSSLGAALLIGYQKFGGRGLHGFAGFTTNPANPAITNLGYDSSHGFGLRLGWMSNVTDRITLGAAYATKMRMSKFDMYKDLFPGWGNFDIPSNMSLGIAYKLSPTWTIASEYRRINLTGVSSAGNPSTNIGDAVAATGYTLGSLGCDACRGFGWRDVNAYKLGVEHQYSPNLILRAGYDHSNRPLRPRDITFNIIAPGVIEDHLTAGFTYNLSKNSELTMAYMHAFKRSLTAPSLLNNWVTTTGGAPGGVGIAGNETLKLYEDSIGIAYGLKFQ
ncbi:MAG: outer membrane protein transport protein [Betaproteobacteria bacterium]|nr:outer membrane protein transport protein [Betaproteobacteria bacterium]